MKRIIIFFGVIFVLLMAGCQSELPASSETPAASEPEVVEVSKLPDFIEWTKTYLKAGDAFNEGGSLAEYEAAISDMVGEDLRASCMEEANEVVADIEINGRVYTRQDKAQLVFGKETKRVEIATDISPVYDDLNPERDFFKTVFVRRTYQLFDKNDDLIPERSHTRLYKYWFQEADEEWKLYSVRELDGFPYDGKEHTRDFNKEPIVFTHYKNYEIDLSGCEQADEIIESSKKEGESNGQVDGDLRLVQGYLIGDEIWGVRKAFDGSGMSQIVIYQLPDPFNEMDAGPPYQLVVGNVLRMDGRIRIAEKDTFIHFESNTGVYIFDYDESRRHMAFTFNKVAPSALPRHYDTLGSGCIEQEGPIVRVLNRDEQILWKYEDESDRLKFFRWNPEDERFAYLSGLTVLKIADVAQKEVISIPLSDQAPERLVDYTNLFWSADGTHVVVEALCEESAVLQVICVATGEVVYEYVLEDDGTLLDVAGSNQLLILDDAKERKLMLCNYETGDEQTLVITDRYIHFAMLNQRENKLIYDLYNPKEKTQTIRIKDISEIEMERDPSIASRKTELQEEQLAAKFNVPLSVIDRLKDKGFISEEIFEMTREVVRGIIAEDRLLLQEMDEFQSNLLEGSNQGFHPIETKIVDVDACFGGLIALDENGDLYTWTEDQTSIQGLLGRYPTDNNRIPIKIQAPEDVEQIGAGFTHAFCITKEGDVYLWGISEDLQGVENREKFREPVKIPFPEPIAKAVVGHSLLGITEEGKLYTWGGNRAGTIGDGTTEFCSIPYHVPLEGKVVDVSGSGATSAALMENGDVYTWGFYSDGVNWLVDSSSPDRKKPYPLDLGEIDGKVIDMEMSAGYGILLTDTNHLYFLGNPDVVSWFSNEADRNSQLVELCVPEEITGLYTGFDVVGAIGNTGKLYEWNFDQNAENFEGRKGKLSIPRMLEIEQPIKEVGAYSSCYLAIAEDHSIYGWGGNAWGAIDPEVKSNWITHPIKMTHFFSYSNQDNQ